MSEKYELRIHLECGRKIKYEVEAESTSDAVEKLYDLKSNDWITIETTTTITEFIKEQKIQSIEVENMDEKNRLDKEENRIRAENYKSRFRER